MKRKEKIYKEFFGDPERLRRYKLDTIPIPPTLEEALKSEILMIKIVAAVIEELDDIPEHIDLTRTTPEAILKEKLEKALTKLLGPSEKGVNAAADASNS